MSDALLEQIIQLSGQLTSDESVRLMEHIQAKLPQKQPGTVTRDTLLAEHERLMAAGAFDHVESLRGKYMNPDIDLTKEEIQAYLQDIGTAWERDIDEMLNDD